MGMSTVDPGTKNDFAGEGQQQFIRSRISSRIPRLMNVAQALNNFDI
jgi:hypothetical protein